MVTPVLDGETVRQHPADNLLDFLFVKVEDQGGLSNCVQGNTASLQHKSLCAEKSNGVGTGISIRVKHHTSEVK